MTSTKSENSVNKQDIHFISPSDDTAESLAFDLEVMGLINKVVITSCDKTALLLHGNP